MPSKWISKNGIDVTDEFIKYAMPLIGDGWPDIKIENGLQRFARISKKFAEKKLPPYVPIRFRV
jgi:6-phosphofructokinase 1